MRPTVIAALGAERGVTLIEILVSLAIFSVVAIGTLGAVGAANSGGFLEGFPVAFVTNRAARDVTVATTYLQTLQEYIASKGVGEVTPGTYCAGSCSAETPLPGDYPTPSSQGVEQPYQLDWTKLLVQIELYEWSGGTGQYVASLGCTGDCLTKVESTLTWQFKDSTRMATMKRFLRP